MHTLNCDVCGEEFLAKLKNAMYCSRVCANKARYIKYPAKYRKKTLDIYGLTEENYLELLESQEFVCKICGKDETIVSPTTGYPYSLSVDHNHETGEVRGLLCRHCNLVLGQVEKRPHIVAKCLEYLSETNSSREELR